ncbi:extracellular solute-binding protein [Azospirillum sp. TSO22-1]|uniref:sensor histidine kinase n=1 Tax=Azospirillum sp. TSO22-1 TaxID=716789 RepID=UPI000D60814F|nr:extracellular solute-binding protein [Azospirillum sp. TSO22-1]PWC35579.1 histidine kinase [Azospirillum sp. TSO22-1]
MLGEAPANGPSLRRRLLVRLFVLLLVVAVVAFVFVRAYAKRAADSAYDQLLSAAALAIADTVRAENGAVTVDLPYSSLSILGMARRDRVFYKVLGPDGELITGYADLAGQPARAVAPVFADAEYRGAAVRVAVLGRFVAQARRTGWSTVVVAQTREERDTLAADIFANAFAPIVLAVLAGAALLWIGVRQALAPLGFLEKLIRARRPNDFSPIQAAAPAEVSQLLGAINHLMARLKGNLDTTRVFLADAAHQIRTPLAALRAQAELAVEETDDATRRRMVERIHRNAVEASQLTSQLLSHAMVVHRGEAMQSQDVDLAALAAQVAHRAEAVAEDTPITIERPTETVQVSGDPVSLREALANLVDNAVKYGGQSPVEVRLHPASSGRGPVLEVADHGPGIADAEKEAVLRRFGRGSTAAGTTGSGLGLAIVAAVADAHGAVFRLLDRPGGGLIARLEFPEPSTPSTEPVAGLAALALVVLLLVPGAGLATEATFYPAPRAEAARLRVHAATDQPAMDALIRDFQDANPDVAIDYLDMNTAELYAGIVSPKGGPLPDLAISSAVDLQTKLVNDGYAQRHRSPATASLPDWANWRDEAFGFTQEPAVIVYNRALVPEAEVPRSRDELIRLLHDRPERYRGRLTTYDVASSGIGYLFATQDSVASSQFWQLTDSLGDLGVKLACCTPDMMDLIERGEALIGYNLLGSYARARQAAGSPLGIVLPSDYTLVMSRVALIPRTAPQPALAGRFIDHLLSERGQSVIAAGPTFYAVSPLAQGPMSTERLTTDLGGPAQRIVVGPALLVFLDDLKRGRFVKQWQMVIERP